MTVAGQLPSANTVVPRSHGFTTFHRNSVHDYLLIAYLYGLTGGGGGGQLPSFLLGGQIVSVRRVISKQ